MKALVTGGAGFIGSHLVDRLIEDKYDVIIVDNLSTGRKENLNEKARFYEGSILSDEIHKIFFDQRPDIVFHLAAQIDVRSSVQDPMNDARNNILGSINILEAMQKSDTRKIIFSSTGGAIYGEQEKFPADETHPAQPVSPYGIAKLAIEHYLFYYNWVYNIQYVSLRYGNVYGPRQNPHGEAGVVAIFCQKMVSNSQPVINGDGKQTRDYVYVKDVVRSNILAVDYSTSDTFNIGTAIESDVNFIFRSLKHALGSTFAEIHGPPKKGEQLRSVLDIGKAKKILNWEPEIDFKRGLELTGEWFKDHPGW